MSRRDLTYEEMLRDPWWGVVCPLCQAAPGMPCGQRDGKIHGQRTYASRSGYIDPRKAEERAPMPAPEPGQMPLDFGGRS